MHELPVVREVLKTVLRYAEEDGAGQILRVYLVIGDMHDLIDEWVVKYFAFASRGTIAEGAEVIIERPPVVCRCNICQEYFIMHLRTCDQTGCPVCGSESFSLCSGDEFMIKGVEVC